MYGKRINQVKSKYQLPYLFTWSSLQIKMANLIDLKGFACHWRFVTRSQQLCSKSFLLPEIKIPSLSLSRRLLQYFNWQASKRNNLAKERDANVLLGVVEAYEISVPGYYSYYCCYYYYYFFFFFGGGRPKFFLWQPFYN